MFGKTFKTEEDANILVAFSIQIIDIQFIACYSFPFNKRNHLEMIQKLFYNKDLDRNEKKPIDQNIFFMNESYFPLSIE